MSEAFVYLWFDSKNRKFYLGKHKGTPDDGYTHSSTIMESFDVPPPHMKRRILAYGTDEEMCLLEHELLTNRKEKKWDQYYNRHLGDPRYIDQSGENNHNYKHGLRRKDCSEEEKKKYNAMKYHRDKSNEEWYQKQLLKGRKRYEKNKEEKLKQNKEYRDKNKDELNAKAREKYRENRQEKLARNKAYYEKNKEQILKKNRVSNKKWREENKEYLREYQKKRNAKKKAEKLAQQTGATLPI